MKLIYRLQSGFQALARCACGLWVALTDGRGFSSSDLFVPVILGVLMMERPIEATSEAMGKLPIEALHHS